MESPTASSLAISSPALDSGLEIFFRKRFLPCLHLYWNYCFRPDQNLKTIPKVNDSVTSPDTESSLVVWYEGWTSWPCPQLSGFWTSKERGHGFLNRVCLKQNKTKTNKTSFVLFCTKATFLEIAVTVSVSWYHRNFTPSYMCLFRGWYQWDRVSKHPGP